MPAIQVSGQLNLVNRDELGVEIERHGLDRRNPEARLFRDDLLFPGDQRDAVGARALHHPAIDLACEQTERQADKAGRLREHAFDGQMRLACIGRAQDGRYGAGPGRRRQRQR